MMYDLTVEEVHTFAVGDGDWVVHNCLSIEETEDLSLTSAREQAAIVKGQGTDSQVLVAVVDRTNGEVYYGLSGDINDTSNLNALFDEILPTETLNRNGTPPYVCAEVSACNQALNVGSNLPDLVLAPVWIDSGRIANHCPNCVYWTTGRVHVVTK